jgi:hypothetical protein
MEKAWANGDNSRYGGNSPGLPREGSHNMHVFCPADERPRIDYLGCVQIVGQPRLGGPIYRKKVSKR